MTTGWTPAGLEERLGYELQDRELLRSALTHKSFCNEHPEEVADHSERLEFLGDAVLDLVVSDWLLRSYPRWAEGELTRVRAELVSEASLAPLGEALGLGAHLRLGRGEEASGGRYKTSLLADAVEAVLGAVYRDGGLSAARQVVERLLADHLKRVVEDRIGTDFKTRLQEHLQALGAPLPSYHLLTSSGPEHQKVYTFEVRLEGRGIGTGRGRTKKAAQQQAAREALGCLEASG